MRQSWHYDNFLFSMHALLTTYCVIIDNFIFVYDYYPHEMHLVISQHIDQAYASLLRHGSQT